MNKDPFTLTDVVTPRPKPYRDLIVICSAGVLVVFALIFYGGFKLGIDRKTTSYMQAHLSISRACIEHVGSLKPRGVTVKPDVPLWIARNCGQIADRSMERISGIRTGMIR